MLENCKDETSLMGKWRLNLCLMIGRMYILSPNTRRDVIRVNAKTQRDYLLKIPQKMFGRILIGKIWEVTMEKIENCIEAGSADQFFILQQET